MESSPCSHIVRARRACLASRRIRPLPERQQRRDQRADAAGWQDCRPKGHRADWGFAGYRRAKNRRLRDSRHKRDLDRVPSAAAPRVEVHLPGSPGPGVDQLIEITLHNRDPLPVGHTGRLRSSDFAAGEGTRVTAELRATRRLHHDAPVQDHAKCRGIARVGGWLRQAISAHLFNLTLVAAVVEHSPLGQDAVLTGEVHLALDQAWERTANVRGRYPPRPRGCGPRTRGSGGDLRACAAT